MSSFIDAHQLYKCLLSFWQPLKTSLFQLLLGGYSNIFLRSASLLDAIFINKAVTCEDASYAVPKSSQYRLEFLQFIEYNQATFLRHGVYVVRDHASAAAVQRCVTLTSCDSITYSSVVVVCCPGKHT